MDHLNQAFLLSSLLMIEVECIWQGVSYSDDLSLIREGYWLEIPYISANSYVGAQNKHKNIIPRFFWWKNAPQPAISKFGIPLLKLIFKNSPKNS